MGEFVNVMHQNLICMNKIGIDYICISSKRISSKWVGHFTQVIKDDSFKVGCSIAKYSEPSGGKKSLMACNYGVGNLQDNPIYQEGETASGCTSGMNPKYTGLCSEKEIYEAIYIRRDF